MYLTKAQRDIKKKKMDRIIQRLMVRFANFVLKSRGDENNVTEKEITDFVETLKK